MLFGKHYRVPLLLSVLSVILYAFFAYDVVRTDYQKLILLYVGLWICFLLLMKYAQNNERFLAICALVFRAIFLLSIPNLSQDFYRFIWDGRMLMAGLNPYLETPLAFIQSGQLPIAQAQELYAGMGPLNASHFTNYPPLNQLCFTVAALFSGHSILGSAIVLRLLIIVADFGTFFFGKRLLKALKMPQRNIFWYLLNPFIIIELTGNLHFEGVMICFLIWSFYLLHVGKWRWSAVLFALSVSVKLVPLLFLPLLCWWFRKPSNTVTTTLSTATKSTFKYQIDLKRLVVFYAIVGSVTLLSFAPFFDTSFLKNYAQTVGLWFQNFEFNASIYYVARAIGYTFRGYNEIAIIGKILAASVFIFVVGLGIYKKQLDTPLLIKHMLWAFAVYLFLSTTVHPWYLSTLLVLSIFTTYRFPLAWSFIVIVSYLAYVHPNAADKSENLWIIAFEYVVVFGVLFYEMFIKKANSKKLASS